MNRIIIAAALAFAAGCGAAEDSDPEAITLWDTEEALELGDLEQAVTVRPAYGAELNNPTLQQCQNPPGAGRVCFIPAAKKVKIHVVAAMPDRSFREFDAQDAMVEISNGFIQGWDQSTDPGAAAADRTVDIVASSGSVGPLTHNISEYLSVTCSSTSGALAESPAIAGTYQKCNRYRCGIKVAAIDANFSNATHRSNVKQDAVGACVALGYGVSLEPGSTRWNHATFNENAPHSGALSTTNNCRISSYVSDANPVTISGTCN